MILNIMIRLRDERNISYLYITHDLSTAYQIGDEIFMLYQGAVTETGDTLKVIENPKHPYVQELIGSIPVPDPTDKWDTNIALPDDEVLRTQVDSGCRFYPRCPHHMDRCLEKQPPLYQIDGVNHQAACYLYDDMPVTE
jgi:peptide/nickel transport system ATP-binding protein